MNTMPDIWFPNIGIKIQHLNKVAFGVFGLPVYWYGLIICIGVLMGLYVATYNAKRTNQNPETYIDFSIVALIFSIMGARMYYVIFSWDNYKNNLWNIFKLRQGGLAIYGGVIAAVITAYIFTKRKKISFAELVDTAAPGLILGQAIGRWGNFFNQEAYGGFTSSKLAMRLKVENAYYIPEVLMDKILNINGVEYLQVHPTFLYESIWNLGVFVILMVYFKHKKFHGEIFSMYLLGYGLGRVWIEGLRTDQLIIGTSNIPVSQLLAGVLIITSSVWMVYKRKKIKKI